MTAPSPPGTRPAVDPSSRVYAIGDIHGRHDLMMALLEKIVEDASWFSDGRRVRIVFLGDYIDRGDHGARVVEALVSLAAENEQGVKILRGNHEDALLEFLAAPLAGQNWLEFGARQTLADYGVKLPSRQPSVDEIFDLRAALLEAMGPHVAFLQSLPCHTSDGDVIFTHAGIDPGDASAMRNEKAMLWGHPTSASDTPVPGKLIVHGHFDDPTPVDRRGRVCVDTGAYYSGVLTAVRLDAGVSFLSVSKV
ncbi:MAG: metallophosphoesterase family protein [Paracoccaceae bacterium]|nr:metallophosphoesterase family protein [Paracoccaceae bacterium]